MANYNRIIMIGNLTKDPEYKQSPSGSGFCRLNIASNRQFRNKSTGLMVQEVCYIDVEVWGNQAESCRQYLQKGRQVLVEGYLKLHTWKNETDGQTRQRHAIVADKVLFLSPNRSAENAIDDTVVTSSPTLSPMRTSAKAKGSSEFDASPDDMADALFKDEPPFEDELPF